MLCFSFLSLLLSIQIVILGLRAHSALTRPLATGSSKVLILESSLRQSARVILSARFRPQRTSEAVARPGLAQVLVLVDVLAVRAAGVLDVLALHV